MKITAAVSRAPSHALSIETLELTPPQDHEVLVRVAATGVCHTDIGMRDSPTRIPRPIVLGHEGAGVVLEVGKSVSSVRPGDHVILSFATCGICSSCVHGDTAYCRHLGQFNFSGKRPDNSTSLRRDQNIVHGHFFGQSSFATHALCHERNTIAVDKDLPLEILGPLGCGFQTGAGAVFNSLRLRPEHIIAVFGVGAVGLAAIMAAKVNDARLIIAVDTNPARLSLAATLGAHHTIDATQSDPFSLLHELAPNGMNFALDTTGNLDVIRQAIQNLAPLGVCGLINTAKGADMTANILDLVLGGKSIRGIHQGDSRPQEFIPYLIDLYRDGRFPFDKLLHFYELADINTALDDMETGRCIKPVIRMPH